MSDSDDRFSLLELDGPTMPHRAIDTTPRCANPLCKAIIAGVRAPAAPDGYCSICHRTRPATTHVPAGTSIPVPLAHPGIVVAPMRGAPSVVVAPNPSLARVVVDATADAMSVAYVDDATREEIQAALPTGLTFSYMGRIRVRDGMWRSALIPASGATPIALIAAVGTAPIVAASGREALATLMADPLESGATTTDAIPSDLAEALAGPIAEGQIMAAQADLVRGGVPRANVNPYAGFQSAGGVSAAQAVAAASLNTEASQSALGQTARAPIAAPSAPAPAWNAPLAADLPDVLRQGIEASRARRRNGATISATPTASQPREAVRAMLQAGDLIAGAAAHGCGTLVGWSGCGTMARPKALEILAASELPEAWAPAIKSALAHAGDAVRALDNSGYVARRDKRKSANGTPLDPAAHGRARWTVGAVGHSGEIGTAFGQTVLSVRLTSTDALEIDGSEDLAARVRSAFDAALAGEIYSAGDVTDWVRGILVNRLGAVRFGGVWYLQAHVAGAAKRLLEVLSRTWGSDFLTGLPIATSDELRSGIASGLVAEADAVIADIASARAAAAADLDSAGRPKSLGDRAATTFHGRLQTVIERCAAYAALLGTEHTAPVRARTVAAMADLESTLGDTVLRGAAIWDELEWEATRE